MFIKWNDKLKIGVEEVDNEHRALIEEFQALYDNMKIGKGHEYYSELLIFLESYVVSHFEHEEKLHDEFNYINCKEHKLIHSNFRERVKQAVEKFDEKEDVSNSDLIEINLMVKNWLINHIMIEDKKFGEFKLNMEGNF